MNWIVELVTNDITTNRILIEAETIEKKSYQTLIVDGTEWTLPDNMGLSFAEVIIDEGGCLNKPSMYYANGGSGGIGLR